jgi:hypothetical protein
MVDPSGWGGLPATRSELRLSSAKYRKYPASDISERVATEKWYFECVRAYCANKLNPTQLGSRFLLHKPQRPPVTPAKFQVSSNLHHQPAAQQTPCRPTAWLRMALKTAHPSRISRDPIRVFELTCISGPSNCLHVSPAAYAVRASGRTAPPWRDRGLLRP